MDESEGKSQTVQDRIGKLKSRKDSGGSFVPRLFNDTAIDEAN